ncbi:MAG: cyclic GMP-AMP synthase DncV-like nucleotidyltransferase, partial [Patescibacteria group bacterium]
MAHGTIIKPLPNHEFDADFLLEMTLQPDWMPKDYIQELYTAFRTSDDYKDRVSRKNRCVRVQYANDMHMDVVPYVEINSLNYI